MKLKHIILLLITTSILLTSCNAETALISSNSETVKTSSSSETVSAKKTFQEIPAGLKVVPDDFSNTESDKYHLVETVDGKEEQVLTSFRLLNPQYTNPITEIDNNTYTLNYIRDDSIYKIGTKKIVNKQGMDLGSYGVTEYNSGIVKLYISNNLDVSTDEGQPWDEIIPIDIESNSHQRTKYVQIAILDSPKKNLNKYSEHIGNYTGKLKEEYTHIFASSNDKYLYYDYIDEDLIPKIYRVEHGQEHKDATVYKMNSTCPVVSLDNSIFAYNYSENASYSTDTKWKTIVEKDEKIIKEYDTKRIIIMDEQDKEIYAIDPVENTLEVLDMTSFGVKFTAKVDIGFLFPQIVNGKLQYTCPTYENGQIKDYVVKEENN